MTKSTSQDHGPYVADDKQVSPDQARHRLYWWNVPVKPENSLEAGQKMLVGSIVWFYGLIAVLAVVGVLLAMTG